MRRRLSSYQTVFMKIVLPGLWVGGVGILVLMSFFNSFSGAPPKLTFLIIWIGGSVFVCWTNVSLKDVSVDENFLYVSNYLKEIAIPLSDIYDVTENRWINFHPVTIHLGSPSEFGHKIVFMPRTRFWIYSPHPVVAELKRLASSRG